VSAGVLANATTSDGYTAATTLEGPPSERVRVAVYNAAVAYQIQIEAGRWEPEEFLGPWVGTFSQPFVTGIRFRSFTPGQPAQVSARLLPAGVDEGAPPGYTVSPAGVVTPSSDLVIKYVSVFPAGAVDGDVIAWRPSPVFYPGVVWLLRFNATDNYWEALAGSNPIYVRQTGANTNGAVVGSWINVSSGALTVPRAGDYFVRAVARGVIGAAGAGTINLAVSKTSVVAPISLVATFTSSASFSGMLPIADRLVGLTAADLLELAVNCNQANCNFDQMFLELAPIRVQ
jgi:hypothetical protein